jgi:hypothetical protein
MNTIVIYPGRYEPPHLGHKASYNQLQKTFPDAKVFVATSGVTAPVTHPFTFADKVELFGKLGIPASLVVQCASPYRAQEITENIPDPENTVLIFAVSAKDMEGDNARFKYGVKKDGSPSYMQPYPGSVKKCKPLTKHAYVYTTDVATFKVMGKDANSATSIRKLYIDGSDQDRERIIHDLYGHTDTAIKQMFDQRLGVAEKVKSAVIQHAPIDANVLDTSAPVQRESKVSKAKLAKLLESIQTLERTAGEAYVDTAEDLAPNYICERSGAEYYWPPKRI